MDTQPSSLSLAPMLDAVCSALQDPEAPTFSVLRVNSLIYDAIADTRDEEVQRGNPVMVLSLEVVSDNSVAVDRAVLD
jgi:hypothetical protein